MSNMWKMGSWSSMEDLLLSNQFSTNEEIGLPNQEILGDENQTALDGLDRLDGLLDEFLAASKSKDETQPAYNSLDNEDFFPEWVENKIDFSLLENLDNLDKLLDDPELVMQEDELSKLSTDQRNTSVKLPSVEIIPKEIDFSLKDAPNSPLHSYPNSPEGIVPNLSAPTSPIASSLRFGNIILSNDVYPSPLPSPAFTTSPTTFTIILPSGNLAGLVAEYQEVAEVEWLPESLSSSLNNTGTILPLSEDVLPVAEKTASNSFEGILKEKQAIKVETVEKVEKVKSERGRKRKIVEKFVASCSNSSESGDYVPPVPKQRKERKRMQNKDAATRYRQKKKAEAEAVGEVEEKLLEKNKGLKDKAQQLSNEISYLKGLMREMFKARGLL